MTAPLPHPEFDPSDYGVLSLELAERIAGSAGLRDILVYEYDDMDHRIVHASIRTALEDFAAHVETIQRLLLEGEGQDPGPI